jgi:hypothetical protein
VVSDACPELVEGSNRSLQPDSQGNGRLYDHGPLRLDFFLAPSSIRVPLRFSLLRDALDHSPRVGEPQVIPSAVSEPPHGDIGRGQDQGDRSQIDVTAVVIRRMEDPKLQSGSRLASDFATGSSASRMSSCATPWGNECCPPPLTLETKLTPG